MEDHTPQALSAARRLRRQMSLPEGLLWQQLRQRPMGLKFRSQHPVGPFVVDFYCAAACLVIEVDGVAHDRGDRPERDARREAWLSERGLRLVRIAARAVLRDPAAVADSIVSLCLAPPPSAAGAAATSPGGGVSSGVPC
ncbi:endonuclease domain-containing protein [Novosphingobium bradum]|uniref:Endonuclease domain-containing protein n=1 Tax=Novosphingobium bradum TaxID=1737444 RepID=A0ABV7ISD1_9SPHN